MRKSVLKTIISMLLIAAMVMVMAGCEKKDASVSSVAAEASVEASTEASVEASTEASVEEATEASTEASVEEPATEEAKSATFKFVVVDADGNETPFEITTEKATVGEALLDEGLIEGTDSAYGLYVTKVNGIEAVYETDGTYWAFYINGEYAMTGVDSTNVEEGATYSFKVEK